MGSGGLCQGGPTQEESIRKNEAIKRAKRDADELAEKDKKKFIANGAATVCSHCLLIDTALCVSRASPSQSCQACNGRMVTSN